MTRSARILVVLVVLALVTLVWEGAPSADAAMNVYTGVVTHVRDGDTIVVDIDPPGNGPEDRMATRDTLGGFVGTVVRIYGVNTFGDEVGEEECWGPAATRFLTGAPGVEFQYALELEGKTVELRGYINHAPDAYGRIPMRVFLDGVDIAKTILKAGLGLPMPSNELSDQQNDGYRQKAANARRNDRRIWDDKDCHGGPFQSAELKLRVRFDADGDDNRNLTGEWVEVINTGTIRVNLLNWELRDSMTNRHLFTTDTYLDPGDRVRVIGGSGTLPPNTPTTTMVRWRNPDDLTNNEEIFLNRGDLAILMDPHDDIRAFAEFPCAPSYQNCSDPYSGSVALWAHYNPPGGGDVAVNEWIDIWNLGNADIDLYNYYLRNDVDTYLFDVSTVIEPGEFLRLRVGQGTNSGNTRYWGKASNDLILEDAGDRVELMGMDGREVACYGWGNESCKKSAINPALEVIVMADGFYYRSAREDLENGYPNREWVRIRNTSGSSVDLANYLLDIPVQVAQFGHPIGSALFDLNTVITGDKNLDPGEVLTFHMGSEPSNPPVGHYYLGFVDSPLYKSGDTVKVWKREAGTSPKIRLAGSLTWPCTSGCVPATVVISDAEGGTRIDETTEYIDITNNTGAPVKLDDWWIKTNFEVHYYFPDGATIPSGGTVRVHTAVGTDDDDDFYWNRPFSDPADDDSGHAIGTNGWAQLFTPKSVVADCHTTGTGTCP